MSDLQITKVEMPQSKYAIKCPKTMTPTYITRHDTYNDASAMAEVSYMISNNNSTSFHFAVDDYRAVQGVPLNRNAHHAGDGANGKGNRNAIGIETCYSKSGGDRYVKANKNSAILTAKLMKQFGIPITNVVTHQHWSGKYCPHRLLSEFGFQYYINLVNEELGVGNVTTKPSTPDSNNQGSLSGEIYRVREGWENTASQKGAFRDLNNAKKYADIYGYKVYNSKGEQIYPESKPNVPQTSLGTYTYARSYANRNLNIKDVQRKLDYLGYSMNPYGIDGSYGPHTFNMVKKFQQDNGLSVDGNVGNITLTKLNEKYNAKQSPLPTKVSIGNPNCYVEWCVRLQKELNRQGFTDYQGRKLVENGWSGKCTLSASQKTPLTEGCQGNITKLVQEALKSLGFYDGILDGKFEGRTKEAVRKYNQRLGYGNRDYRFGEGCWKAILGM